MTTTEPAGPLLEDFDPGTGHLPGCLPDPTNPHDGPWDPCDCAKLLYDLLTDVEPPDEVRAAHRWPTNAHMVEDLVRLGYLRPGWRTLDPTWGEGKWWTRWKPERLTCHDLYKLDGVDFRRLPEPDHWFDAAVYDPPYVSVGGRETSSIPEFQDRYGLDQAPETKSPKALQAMVDAGLAEVARTVKPRGFVLAKCMAYVSGGHLWPGDHMLQLAAVLEGLEVFDVLRHVGDPRAQPKGRSSADPGSPGGRKATEQQHSRQNYSTLLVLRAPKRHQRKLW